MLGRLKEGASLDQARADVERVFGAQAAQHPSLYEDNSVRTERLQDVLTERVARWMRLVLAAVAILMADPGALNVSNLLLTCSVAADAATCRIRLSLGATQIQVMAAALVEGVLLAGCATVAGLVAASWLLTMVKAALPPGIVLANAVQVDSRVFLACAAAGGLTALVAGLLPGGGRLACHRHRAEGHVRRHLRTPSRRLQESLLVLQVALVTTLFAGSTLLVFSFVRALGIDLGFARHNLAGVQLAPSFREALHWMQTYRPSTIAFRRRCAGSGCGECRDNGGRSAAAL